MSILLHLISIFDRVQILEDSNLKKIALIHQNSTKTFIENEDRFNKFKENNENILFKIFNLKLIGDDHFNTFNKDFDTGIFNNLKGFEYNDVKRNDSLIHSSFGYNFFKYINKLIELPASGEITNIFSANFYMYREIIDNEIKFNYGLNFEFKKGAISIKVKESYLDINIIFMSIYDDFLSINTTVDENFNIIGKSTFLTETIMDEDLDLNIDKLLHIIKLIYSANLNNNFYPIHEIENLINEIILGKFENVNKYCVLQEMAYI